MRWYLYNFGCLEFMHSCLPDAVVNQRLEKFQINQQDGAAHLECVVGRAGAEMVGLADGL
jgi:hypothetical protein